MNVGTAILRIGSETSLTLTNVNDGSVQVHLNQGTLNLHVRKLYGGEIYEVDTPNLAEAAIPERRMMTRPTMRAKATPPGRGLPSA